jgi:hypothetical protein
MAARTTTTPRPRATSSRTTAKKPKIDFDLDAALAEELDDEDGDAPTKVVQILGEPYTIKCRVNEFLLNGALSGDPQALHKFFESLMSREDYLRFKTAMSDHPNMNSERFIKTFTKLLEVVAERPTN